MIRSGLVFIPVLWLMNTILGLTGIQISQTISDIVSASITLPMVVKFSDLCQKTQKYNNTIQKGICTKKIF